MGRKGWGWVGNSWRDYFECWGLELGEVRSKLRARRFFMAASSSGSFRRMLSHFSLFMCQAGKNAAGGGQDRVAFYVQDLCGSISRKPQFIFSCFQDHSVPFFVVFVTEDSVSVLPRILRLCAVLVHAPGEQFLSCHSLSSS